MFKAGNIPGAYKLATGTIVVPEAVVTNKPPLVVTYARVSSAENKDNLRAQSARLVAFCNAKGWQTHQNIQEVGSGLNDKRPKLLKVLSDGLATKLVVEHKDRLARFGVRYVEALCKHVGCELVVINEAETDEADLVQDFTSIITSFCARVYGLRRSKRKTEQLIAALANKGSA